jgi:hypothetical protein
MLSLHVNTRSQRLPNSRASAGKSGANKAPRSMSTPFQMGRRLHVRIFFNFKTTRMDIHKNIVGRNAAVLPGGTFKFSAAVAYFITDSTTKLPTQKHTVVAAASQEFHSLLYFSLKIDFRLFWRQV